MNYQELKNKYLWTCTDIDGNGYRCTDTPKLRLHYCDGYSIKEIMSLGNPVEYKESLPKKFSKFQYFLTNDKQLNAGDILVAPTLWILLNWKKTGHTALFDSYWTNGTINVFEQNWVGKTNGTCGKGNEHRIKNYPLATFPYFITDKPLKVINPNYKEQSDFSMEKFIETYEGKYIDADRVRGSVCNDLVKQFLLEKYAIPVFSQTAYTFRIGNFCKKYRFERIEMDSETVKTLKEGDILVKRGVGGKPWHIGICVSMEKNYQDTGIVAIHTFEQNAGGSGACKRCLRGMGSWTEVLRKV